MCFGLDSAPPIPVISGAAVSHDDLVLEARDGNRFAAFLATPEEPSDKGVVILPDVRGLYPFTRRWRCASPSVATRRSRSTTSAGRPASRSATTSSSTGRTWTRSRPSRSRLTSPRLSGTCARSGVTSVFTMGFCMGGRQSWLAAAAGHGLAGAVGFYGRSGEAADGSAGPQQLGAQDRGAGAGPAGRRRTHTSPRRSNEAFEAGLSPKPASSTSSVVYEGAPHSFFDRKQDEFAAASEDAWARVLEFVERHGA